MKNYICPFCMPEKIEGRVLHETEHFRVVVGINIISAGHVMIVSKEHLPAFGAMPSEYDKEFWGLVDKVKKKITEKFSEPMMIEYGNWGQSVFHAHMHFVPKISYCKERGYEVRDIMHEMFDPICKEDCIDCERDIPWERVCEVYKEINGYVLAIDNDKINIIKTGDKLDQSCVKHGLSHRAFFQYEKGLEGTRGWSKMTEEEKARDERNVQRTKELLVF